MFKDIHTHRHTTISNEIVIRFTIQTEAKQTTKPTNRRILHVTLIDKQRQKKIEKQKLAKIEEETKGNNDDWKLGIEKQ